MKGGTALLCNDTCGADPLFLWNNPGEKGKYFLLKSAWRINIQKRVCAHWNPVLGRSCSCASGWQFPRASLPSQLSACRLALPWTWVSQATCSLHAHSWGNSNLTIFPSVFSQSQKCFYIPGDQQSASQSQTKTATKMQRVIIFQGRRNPDCGVYIWITEKCLSLHIFHQSLIVAYWIISYKNINSSLCQAEMTKFPCMNHSGSICSTYTVCSCWHRFIWWGPWSICLAWFVF